MSLCHIKRLIINPVYNGSVGNIAIFPCKLYLTFNSAEYCGNEGRPEVVITHEHNPDNTAQSIIDVDIEFDYENYYSVDGKLYALDRSIEGGRYFTLYPSIMPKNITDTLEITIVGRGPAVSFMLSVRDGTDYEELIKEPSN